MSCGRDSWVHRPILDPRLRTVFRASLAGLMVLDDDRRCVSLNDSAGRLLGAPASELVGRGLADFVPLEHRDRLERFWTRLQTDAELEGGCELLPRNGSILPIAFRAIWSYGPGEHIIAATETPWAAASSSDSAQLTRREREVIRLVADGCSNKEIASQLVLSPATVKTHLSNIYEKLEVTDRAAAVAVALRAGTIS